MGWAVGEEGTLSAVWGSGFHWVGIRSAVWASAERPPLEGWGGARTQPDGRSGVGHRERGRGADLTQDDRTQQLFEDGETRSFIPSTGKIYGEWACCRSMW